ncbi:MAG TPA: glycoside hydrolase family 172 protein, partial [Bacteroidota bacterium]|nr:glycoside hydrolase family 172 protein [Bacteroidota bacterium]
SILPGATAPLAEITGPGVVTMIWVTISSSDPWFLRRILLRMYWDGEKSPSVEVPIGDFFGTGFQYKQYLTPFVGMSSGGYFSYFPMPFNTGARIEVVNETGQPIDAFYYHIDYQKLGAPLEPSVARFHASWHREIRTVRGRYFTILEAEGEGHLVGVNLSMQSYDGGLSFLEGDEMIYVDGEKEASVKGTGTEDYFNSGWYFNRGEFAAPYHGLIIKDDSLGRIAAYRFHVLDVIPFKKSIRALIEHGDRNTEIADYSATAYWYQKEPHRPFEPMLAPSLRIPLRVQVPNGALEGESLTPGETSLPFAVEDMSAFGAEWSGQKQLRVEGKKPGDSFTLSLPAAEDRYDLDMYFTKGPALANVDVRAGGRTLGSFKAFDNSVLPGGSLSLPDIHPLGGEIRLQFVIAGKDTRSRGYAVGIDAISMRPHREFIPAWSLIGPFPNPRDPSQKRLGLDMVYAPEKEIDIAKTYAGAEGRTIGWQHVKTPKSGLIDLTLFDPHDLVVAYAFTYVYSPEAQTLPLLFGSDDGVKVFLNGDEVYRLMTVRGTQVDQDSVSLHLKKGWNRLLLKIENNFGGYGFCARIPAPANSLKFNALKPEADGTK